MQLTDLHQPILRKCCDPILKHWHCFAVCKRVRSLITELPKCRFCHGFMEQSYQCCICMQSRPFCDMIKFKCNHAVCSECAKELWSFKHDKCPMCRAKIPTDPTSFILEICISEINFDPQSIPGSLPTLPRLLEMQLTKSSTCAITWFNLGVVGGGLVLGHPYTMRDCFVKALEQNERLEHAWYNLGIAGGGVVHQTHYSSRECFQKQMCFHPCDWLSWNSLGCVGGGTIQGSYYSSQQCFIQALTLNDADATTWCNLGVEGGGLVKMQDFTPGDCFENALWAQDEMIGKTLMHIWYNLGLLGGREVCNSDKKVMFTAEACFRISTRQVCDAIDYIEPVFQLWKLQK